MSSFFIALLALGASTFRTHAAQQAEIVALRHQVAVLQQSAPPRLRLRQSDRLLWIGLSSVWPGWRRNLTVLDEMPLLLRTVRQIRWLKEDAAPFLAFDDVPADPVCDLSTQQNLLSVWEVAQDRSNIERIVRAVAIGRDRIAHMGYVVFESGPLPEAEIDIRNNKGASFDEGANVRHRDLVVSGNKLVALTKAILRHGESGIVLKVRLQQLVEEGIRDGQIPDKVRTKL